MDIMSFLLAKKRGFVPVAMLVVLLLLAAVVVTVVVANRKESQSIGTKAASSLCSYYKDSVTCESIKGCKWASYVDNIKSPNGGAAMCPIQIVSCQGLDETKCISSTPCAPQYAIATCELKNGTCTAGCNYTAAVNGCLGSAACAEKKTSQACQKAKEKGCKWGQVSAATCTGTLPKKAYVGCSGSYKVSACPTGTTPSGQCVGTPSGLSPTLPFTTTAPVPTWSGTVEGGPKKLSPTPASFRPPYNSLPMEIDPSK